MAVITLWPPDAEPDALYAYPEGLIAPWVRVNFVASVDGAAAVDGVSGGLGSPADKRVFGLLRELSQVVLVGAGTARAENYRGTRRPTRGTAVHPPIAVVTGSAAIDPTSPLLTDTSTPPIVLTTPSAPRERRDALTAAGADVVTLPDLTPASLLAELGRRGLHRVLCEGGPRLHHDLVAADAVDELCLTIAPLMAGGGSTRIVDGPAGTPPRDMSLASALQEDDVLLLRYRRLRRSGDIPGGSAGHPRQTDEHSSQEI